MYTCFFKRKKKKKEKKVFPFHSIMHAVHISVNNQNKHYNALDSTGLQIEPKKGNTILVQHAKSY